MLDRLKPVLHGLFQRLGFDIVRYDGRRYLNQKRIELIREREVNRVLDVGANLGQCAFELRRDGYHGHIVSFEPLTRAFTARWLLPLDEIFLLALCRRGCRSSPLLRGRLGRQRRLTPMRRSTP
jgi:hypothetical protein